MRCTWIAAVILLLASAANAATYRARVWRIVDGDTLIVIDARGAEHRVRIDLIDAPEPDQPYGKVAAEQVRAILKGDSFTVSARGQDGHGRELVRVIYDGADLGLTLVQGGFAWVSKELSARHSEAENALYSSAEAVAREKRRGLWRSGRPESPWKHRAAEQRKQRSQS